MPIHLNPSNLKGVAAKALPFLDFFLVDVAEGSALGSGLRENASTVKGVALKRGISGKAVAIRTG